MSNKTKAIVAAVAAVLMVVALVIAVAVSPGDSTGPSDYDRCKDRLATDFREGNQVSHRPEECAGVADDDLQRIVGEIISEEVHNG